MDRIKLTLGNQLFFYTLLLSLFPLMIAGIFLLRLERQHLIAQAERELNILSQAMRVDLVNQIDELRTDAQLIAQFPDIQSMEAAQQEPYLELALEHYNRYGQLAIIDLSGETLRTGREQAPINILHIESFRKAAGGEQAWVVAPALFSDNLVLHMHTPIMSDNSEDAFQVGVLGSPSSFYNLSGFLDKYDHGMPGSVFVLGADNRILIHPDQEIRETRPDYSELVSFDELQLAKPVRIEADGYVTKNGIIKQDGISFLASFTSIEDLGWTIVAKKRLSVVLAPAHFIQNIGFVAISILIVLNLLLLIFIRRRMTHPIEILALAVKEFEAGNSEALVPVMSFRHVQEISQLVRSFTSMRSAVVDREQKLQKFAETLEEKIEIRTAELQALNSYLEHEIEEHKRTTLELEISRDELEMASKAKDSFLARMSHELRTPLNAIIGYSELMEEDAIEENEPDVAEDANTIKRAAHHLSTIISNILDYSEIQSESMQLNKSHFCLDNLIENVVFTVRSLANKNENQLIVNNFDPGEYLFTDELKVRQILIHLLGNAAKFTAHGTISLDVSIGLPGDPQIPLNDHRNWLLIRVSDTGVGILEESVDSIFDPFSQVDESLDRTYEGTGLGLVLTRNFVEILGGSIHVDSQYGSGSSFEVKIPLEAVPV
ncbi:MAG: sensor histidine kinase [Anaerolineae bacterium]